MKDPAAPSVIALVASAGGLDAVSSVLRELPEDFPAAVIVAQHLGGRGSALAEILRHRISLPVSWASDGMTLAPGHVLVAPPRTAIRALPDGTLALTPAPNTSRSGPFDTLLTSLAESFGPRAAAAVLSGMGRDGTLGARALKDAGGTVVAQSPRSAEHSRMPDAAVEAGAVDVVLDVHDIGPALLDLVRGGGLPHRGAGGTSSDRSGHD